VYLEVPRREEKMALSTEPDFDDLLENTTLDPRLVAVLRRNRFRTLSSVAQMSDTDILMLDGIGRYYLSEIRRAAQEQMASD
jgi:DNA-directed RNA polymerase alpha subunit